MNEGLLSEIDISIGELLILKKIDLPFNIKKLLKSFGLKENSVLRVLEKFDKTGSFLIEVSGQVYTFKKNIIKGLFVERVFSSFLK